MSCRLREEPRDHLVVSLEVDTAFSNQNTPRRKRGVLLFQCPGRAQDPPLPTHLKHTLIKSVLCPVCSRSIR